MTASSRPLDTTPIAVEAQRLLGLAEELAERSGRPEAWGLWVRYVAATLETESDLDAEWRLVRATHHFRTLWLQDAAAASDPTWRSPLRDTSVWLPRSGPINFSYERNLQPEHLEGLGTEYRLTPGGWEAETVLYSSGMSALASFLTTYAAMANGKKHSPLHVLTWANYFESHVLLELMRGGGITWSTAEGALEEAIRSASPDICLVEPVRYDWDLPALDARALARGILQSGTSALLLDTTLSGHTFPVPDLLRALDRATAPPLVVQYSSGLKLDQQGLELANVGILTVYAKSGTDPSATAVAAVCRKMRTILGTAPSLATTAALEAPFFLDRHRFEQYAADVFLNNALLASAVPPGALFRRVVHPVLQQPVRPWSSAPFVVFDLREDTLENHGVLLGVIALEVRRRGLCFFAGSSFGFRHHRYETIIPSVQVGRGLFKIAMGARSGPSRDGIVRLLVELSQYESFAALRGKYPDVRPVEFDLS